MCPSLKSKKKKKSFSVSPAPFMIFVIESDTSLLGLFQDNEKTCNTFLSFQ